MFSMLVVLKWLDRLVMAQRCLASLLVKRTTDPASQTSPTCQTGLPNKQKMVACEYQLSGKPLGYIVLADLADMAANMVADPDPANMDTLGECVHAKVWIMLNKLEVAHPARLLLVDQFTVMIGHAGPNILDVCVDELMRAELFVIGPYQLPSRLAKLAETDSGKALTALGTKGSCQVYTALVDRLGRWSGVTCKVAETLQATCIERYKQLDGVLKKQYLDLLEKTCQRWTAARFTHAGVSDPGAAFVDLARIGLEHGSEAIRDSIVGGMAQCMSLKERMQVWRAGLKGLLLGALSDNKPSMIDMIIGVTKPRKFVTERLDEEFEARMAMLADTIGMTDEPDALFRLVETATNLCIESRVHVVLACKVGLLGALKHTCRLCDISLLLGLLAQCSAKQVHESGLLSDALSAFGLAKTAKLPLNTQMDRLCWTFGFVAKFMSPASKKDFVLLLSKHRDWVDSYYLRRIQDDVDDDCKALLDQMLNQNSQIRRDGEDEDGDQPGGGNASSSSSSGSLDGNATCDGFCSPPKKKTRM